MKYYDDYEDEEACPKCGHDWVAHFAMITEDGELTDEPYPIECMECKEDPGCKFALE